MKQNLISIIVISSVLFCPSMGTASDAKMNKLMAQSRLEDEGNRLVEQGLFDEAILKYSEVLKSENWTYEWETSLARGKIISILKLQSKYEEALKALQWQLKANPKKFEPWRRELVVLIEYQKTNDPKAVYEHIKYRKELYPKWMPPYSYADTSGISSILRLYATIGDYDGGISFIDQNLSFLKKHQERFGEDPKIYETVKTSAEATKCAELDKRMRKRNANWRSCNLIREHLLVREGFEKDKKNGGPDCAGQKYCLGSATKALIQSDYFPW